MAQHKDLNSLLRRAISEHTNGKIEKARLIYEEILLHYPDNYDALNLTAVIEYQLNNYEKAIKLYERALKISPDSAEILTNYAAALKAIGKTHEAMFILRKAININSSFVLSHFNLANLLMDIDKKEALSEYEIVVKLDPQNNKAYKKISWIHHLLGQYEIAILYLNKALEINSNDYETYHVLGSVYRAMGKYSDAILAYEKSLSINSNNITIQHLLVALKGQNSETAPAEYVKYLFDDASSEFDNKLVGELHYKTPTIMRLIFDKIRKDGTYKYCLDLGCGTGLSGIEFEDIVDYLTGVDISEGMITEAYKKNIYDQLIVSEISDYLINNNYMYDLILSSDVLVYIGKLDKLFNDISMHIKKGGYFIFSIELVEYGGYKIRKTGRYGHSHNYIDKISSLSGFSIIKNKDVNLRKESKSWVKGSVYVLKKL